VRAQDGEGVSVQPEPGEKYELKGIRLPVVTTSKEEIEAYERDPTNKPKIDFTPRGTRAQLSEFSI
jgi:hypothetical protein